MLLDPRALPESVVREPSLALEYGLMMLDDACKTTPRHLLPGCPLAMKAEDPAPVVNCQVAHAYARVASNTVASWDVAWSIAGLAGSKP